MPTIQKRGDTYRIRVSAGYDAAGKQIMRSTTWRPAPGMTQKQIDKELERQAVLFEDRVKSGQYMDSSVRFQDFAERWFTDYGKKHLKQTTYRRYEYLAKRIYPALGHIRLDKLQPHHLLEFYKQLEEPGQKKSNKKGDETPLLLSARTIRAHHGLISSILEKAVQWGVLNDNPARRVDAPKAKRKPILFLDDKQTITFMQALEKETLEYRVIFTILILTGMRRGELLGLEWPDIDFENSTIHIRRASQYVVGAGTYTDTPKTEQSKRALVIPPELLDLLRQYRKEQIERRLKLGDKWDTAWSDHPRLFTQWNGKPMFLNSPYKELQKILEQAGLPKVSLHSLRHTNATLLIGSGLDVRSVSGRLGHSQTSTTLNIYSEYLQSANAAASEMLANTLLRQKTTG